MWLLLDDGREEIRRRKTNKDDERKKKKSYNFYTLAFSHCGFFIVNSFAFLFSFDRQPGINYAPLGSVNRISDPVCVRVRPFISKVSRVKSCSR